MVTFNMYTDLHTYMYTTGRMYVQWTQVCTKNTLGSNRKMGAAAAA